MSSASPANNHHEDDEIDEDEDRGDESEEEDPSRGGQRGKRRLLHNTGSEQQTPASQPHTSPPIIASPNLIPNPVVPSVSVPPPCSIEQSTEFSTLQPPVKRRRITEVQNDLM